MESKSTVADWRERRNQYFNFYRVHPHTIKQTVTAGIYPNYKIAARCLGRHQKRKRGITPRVVGLISFHDTGREAKVFSSWRPRHVRHEVLLTSWIIQFGLEFNWKRGINTHPEYRPDAEVPGLMIEFDTGTENKKQIQRQVKNYKDLSGTVLWVFHDAKRFDWVTEVGNRANTLLTTTDSDIIFDFDRNSISVEQLRDKLR